MSTTNEYISINEKYKDKIFCLLFGREEYKDNILSLYNALNNTNYSNVDDIEIATIEDTIYIRMKNDVSFLIGSYLSLWEQQSTFNPNMPVRGLMYYGNLYNSYIHDRGLNIYGSSLMKIPTPKCKVLSDYMTLINKIRIYKKEMANIKEAVDRAVNECIEEEILVEFLRKHRGDIMANVLTEFNEEVFVRGIREEGREEGREEARVEYIHVMIETLREVGQSEEVIAQKLMEKYGLTIAETENYMN